MKQFLLLLIVAGFCTSSLTYADEVYPASILQNPWNCIMTKWLIDSRGSISLDTFKGYLLNPQSACQRDQSILPTPPIAGLFDNYPKCDTTDITLGNGQVWSACNVGATQAYTGTSYNGLFSPMPTKMQIGYYFQW